MHERTRRNLWLLTVLCVAVILITQGILFYRIQLRLVWLEASAEWRTEKINEIRMEQEKLHRSFVKIENSLNLNQEK